MQEHLLIRKKFKNAKTKWRQGGLVVTRLAKHWCSPVATFYLSAMWDPLIIVPPSVALGVARTV
jgi:hypothetical protein